ncbi:MAG: hypothetical protein ACRDJE_09535 [Dehalococcoidia bacterium]
MPIPETLLRWFESDLAPDETARSAANADLWLRYRRLVLTDRRILAVERFNVRHPGRGRTVESTPLASIRGYRLHRGRMVTTLRLKTDSGPRVYRMLNRSLGTGRFTTAVEQALSAPPPLPADGGAVHERAR